MAQVSLEELRRAVPDEDAMEARLQNSLQGLGSRVQGSGFRVEGLGFGVFECLVCSACLGCLGCLGFRA